jgi:hypothetical protein
MGRSGLIGMIEAAGAQQALVWHLRANLFPPKPEMGDAATDAIAAVREGEPDREIELPIETFYRGRPTAAGGASAEALRLDVFLEYGEPEPDEGVDPHDEAIETAWEVGYQHGVTAGRGGA